MELIRGLHNLRHRHRGCVATIGNYDGVHLGHRHVLAGLRERAQQLGCPSAVVTFEPTPQEYFAPERAPVRLSRLREKLIELRHSHIDRVLCLRFNRALASMPAETFIRCVLVDGLAVRYLVVGDDFRFGKDRQGDFHMLQQAGAQYGFEVARMPACLVDGERVSSTRVRAALGAGDLDLAARLLGRPYTVAGRVVHGKRLGRTLGFPTVNIPLGRGRSPVAGIYAVTVVLDDGVEYAGVASVGTRPTVAEGQRMLLEVYLLDFSGNLYGRYLAVRFLRWLRAEEKFGSMDAMVKQMRLDERQARDFLAAM